jgi:hypothetical protein
MTPLIEYLLTLIATFVVTLVYCYYFGDGELSRKGNTIKDGEKDK